MKPTHYHAWHQLARVHAVSCTWLVFCALTSGVSRGQNQDQPPAVGISERSAWTTSQVIGFPDPPPAYELERAYPELEVENLLALNRIPESSYLLAINHQTEWGGPSRIVQFEQQGNGGNTTVFLERPEIIYGLAFSPVFASDHFVYVGCNGYSDQLEAVATRVLRFQVQGDGPFVCDPNSLKVIIEWKSNGHNGGDLAFGNDGMLYVTAGDGTSDSDQNRTGQDLTKLPGSLLRIDVSHPSDGRPYAIPEDNPFVSYVDADTGSRARGEIWAYGLRNPWRVSIDPLSNQLWVGNNGQDLWESVYLIEKGANYGWSIRESNHDFHTEQDSGPAPISLATVEHHHREARSLTGGHVYRGQRLPELVGSYLYGDFSTGNVWSVRHDGGQVTQQQHVARSTAQITGFGLDHDGEILVADHIGRIYRLRRREQTWTDRFPKRLSQTGLFRDVAAAIPEAGVIPYSVNAPLWSDGATKYRWMAVPGAETIQYKPRGSWEFPDGSVLVKSFAFPDRTTGALRTFETRLMARQEGEWYGYSYRWNESQTDALLVADEGRDEALDWVDHAQLGESPDELADFTWHYPSRTECMVCHSRAAGFVLGLSTEQLTRTHVYDSPAGARAASQTDTLHHIGLTGGISPKQPTPEEILVDPHDASLPLDARARSYLHANCSSCHMEAGGGNARIDLTFTADLLRRTKLLNTDPLHGTLDLKDARLVTPGNADRSVLYARVSRRGPGQMPPLGTHRVDRQAVALLRRWIESLDTHQ